MATKNFRSTVLEPTSEFARGDKLRFTALATVSEVLKGSFSETTIGEDGVYSVDLQYGKHRVDYKPYEGVWRHFADVEVNADTLATTLQDLALSSVPTTDETVLVLQGILADAVSAKDSAVNASLSASASKDDAEAAKSAAELAAASDYAVAFEHYVTLPSKVTVPALGLSDAEVAAYTYDKAEKYSPVNASGDSCYVDIPEFNFVFNSLTIPESLSAYIVFFANVQGLTSAAQDSATFVNLLRYQYAISQFVAIKSNTGSNAMQILAKNWEDKYIDRNELPVDYPGDEYRETFNYGAGVLRVLNLGERTLEIFGVGLVIKK